MDQPSREDRAAALAARLRQLPPEEVTRLGLVLLVRTAMSLVLQLVLLGVGARTARELHRNRHLGRRRLRPLLVTKPLVTVSGLSVLNSGLTGFWLIRWIRRLDATTSN